MEISPDGATLAAPQPLRPIHQPARAAADVPGLRRRADGGDARPAPAEAGRRQAASSSPARCRTSRPPLQQELVARYDRLRTQKVDPREDNALAITTDGRKLALDARLLSATAEDFPGLEDQRPGRQRRRHLAEDRRHARHADDLLRHGRQSRRPGASASMTRSSTS